MVSLLSVLVGAGGGLSAQAWVGTVTLAKGGQRSLPAPHLTHRGISTGLRRPRSHATFPIDEVTPLL